MSRRPHVVAKVSEIPEGTHRVVKVGNREFGIFNVGGSFYALPNVCLHQAGPLCRGRLGDALTASAESDWQLRWDQRGEVVACPWHSLEFNVTTGRCLAYPNRSLRTFEVVVDGQDLKLML
jgi:3-phenylpropionate/trans-cinnamate dioxygenase ferredoxin subunit